MSEHNRYGLRPNRETIPNWAKAKLIKNLLKGQTFNIFGRGMGLLTFTLRTFYPRKSSTIAGNLSTTGINGTIFIF